MKKILFVINTLGRAGAETALLELLNHLDTEKYEISLYVLLGQGEMISRVPPEVHLKNKRICEDSVLSGAGRRKLLQTSVMALFRHGHTMEKIRYLMKNLRVMKKAGKIQPDKLLWRVLSDGADRLDETFDLAVAYLEGGSAYYVADHVNAKKKAAFVHIAYGDSGYTREMDRDCYEKMDVIYTVSGETRRHFLEFYPEYEEKVQVFHNIIDRERIEREAKKPGGFSDSYDGVRILTVGRLAHQKAYDIAILAMKQIRDAGYKARWYVVGEGPERKALEKQIAELRLQKDFILLGIKENPFPYYAQCDLYVHATRFEGKSIAIQEAQALGCAVIASDCAGNREQIEDGVDGLLCLLTPEGIARKIEELIDDTEKKEIEREAKKPGGFSDSYDGVRILTVGRLAHQKAYDIAILAMKQIRDAGYKARWYVVGEGPERKALEKQIAELRLQKDFILLGIKENPFPYYAQCDLYVHATRFEGKSIAIQEAQALGCAVIASDCAGNREQIEDGVDGLLCLLTPEGIARKIEELIDDTEKKERIVAAAKQKGNGQTEEIWRLLDLMK